MEMLRAEVVCCLLNAKRAKLKKRVATPSFSAIMQNSTFHAGKVTKLESQATI